ncbi:hypothetical protein IFM89_020655 [Coptis chinensis]|uniref:Subtilisin-like protease fibronectin type-III domain-containing protein n=1 Tax=Coptis chinensis TaxID=261450 RepID=A0A835M8Q2_9MAGN|nr:hypothetical protein IFM89_020655 [Coptis chinensis]
MSFRVADSNNEWHSILQTSRKSSMEGDIRGAYICATVSAIWAERNTRIFQKKYRPPQLVMPASFIGGSTPMRSRKDDEDTEFAYGGGLLNPERAAAPVTNVGPAHSTYNATINAPPGVEINVNPTTLVFTRALQTRKFKVVVSAKEIHDSNLRKPLSGSLVWSSGRHVIKSPIVIYLE